MSHSYNGRPGLYVDISTDAPAVTVKPCAICGATPGWESCSPITHAYRQGWNDAIAAAVRECEGERAACERHHKAQPRRLNHKVGMQIATVCAHRVGVLQPKSAPEPSSEEKS